MEEIKSAVNFSPCRKQSKAKDSAEARRTATCSLMGFLVSTDGFAGAAIDHQSREIALTVPLAAGAERRFLVRVLAPRRSRR